MKRSRSPDTPPPKVADIVQLNVGGRVFDTTASTLSVSRFFEPLLEGRMDSGKDRNGRLFIDRDGSLFAILLNYMRTNKLHLTQAMIEERRSELLAECEFFQLDSMIHRVKGEVL